MPASGTRFLQAGIGWGGSCFGKDTSALISTAKEYSLTMPIVEAAREINRRQRERVVEKLLGELKILKGRTIGLLGLAFKPNTDDLREAPAIDIARKLIDRGCKVKVRRSGCARKVSAGIRQFGRDLLCICRRSGRRCGCVGAGHRMATLSGSGLGSVSRPNALANRIGRPQRSGSFAR